MLNLSLYTATKEQLEDGVIEPSPEIKEKIEKLLTFDQTVMKEPEQLWNRAKALVGLVKRTYPGIRKVMVDCVPFFMPALVKELKEQGFEVYFSYTDTVISEVRNEDGSTTKALVFKHLGFVTL